MRNRSEGISKLLMSALLQNYIDMRLHYQAGFEPATVRFTLAPSTNLLDGPISQDDESLF